MPNLNTIINDLFGSLRNDSSGYSQRKLIVSGIASTVIIANIAYIYTCYKSNTFDGTFIAWQTTMIGFISATFVALYGTKNKANAGQE